MQNMNNTLKWIGKAIGKRRWMIAALTGIQCLIAVSGIIFALLMRKVVDHAVAGEETAFWGAIFSLAGLILIGFGCAPVYPCVIHSTPEHFGAKQSQAIIGVQMACAYVGICLMPPLFGLIANRISVALMPVYLLAILLLMAVMHERMLRKV